MDAFKLQGAVDVDGHQDTRTYGTQYVSYFLQFRQTIQLTNIRFHRFNRYHGFIDGSFETGEGASLRIVHMVSGRF